MVIIRPIEHPDAGLVYSAANTQLKIGNHLIGIGTLYVNQNSLEWMPVNRPEGLSILWKQISVHGITPNPIKSIYFMLDHKLYWQGVYGENGSTPHENESGDEDEDSISDEMTELWLIPTDPNIVDTIYQAMTDCQALHPDSADSISESDGEFMDFDAVVQDRGDDDDDDNVGENNMQGLNINDERFADAEE